MMTARTARDDVLNITATTMVVAHNGSNQQSTIHVGDAS